MQIQIKQHEIEAAITAYIGEMGINISNKTIAISFTAGRKEAGLSADILIEDQGPIKPCQEVTIAQEGAHFDTAKAPIGPALLEAVSPPAALASVATPAPVATQPVPPVQAPATPPQPVAATITQAAPSLQPKSTIGDALNNKEPATPVQVPVKKVNSLFG